MNFEDSRAYLESEGINVDELIKEGMVIIDKVKEKLAKRQAERIMVIIFILWIWHELKNAPTMPDDFLLINDQSTKTDI